MMIVALTLFFAIYFIAKKKEVGWWLGMFSGVTMTVAAYSVHFARPKASFSLAGKAVVGAATPSIFTSVYFLGRTLGITLVIVLLIPFFRNRLVSEE